MERTTILAEILDFIPEYRDDFKRLNAEWMSVYFGKSMDTHLENPEETILKDGGFILFAKADEQIVGTAAILRETAKIYEIADMAVTPQYRGQNIGKQLLAEAVERVKKMGARQVYLITSSKLSASVELYRTYGFRETHFDPEMSIYEGSDIKMILNLK